jgi:hypothetical protein
VIETELAPPPPVLAPDASRAVGSGAGCDVSGFSSEEHDTAVESKAAETAVPKARRTLKALVVISAMI